MRPRVPSFHGPASIAAITMLAGLALMYWALSGFGIIAGNTTTARYTGTIEKIRTPNK